MARSKKIPEETCLDISKLIETAILLIKKKDEIFSYKGKIAKLELKVAELQNQLGFGQIAIDKKNIEIQHLRKELETISSSHIQLQWDYDSYKFRTLRDKQLLETHIFSMELENKAMSDLIKNLYSTLTFFGFIKFQWMKLIGKPKQF